MPHTTYCSFWIRGENGDVSNWGAEAISPMKCLILQVYFLLPKLCLTSSYEPGMICHWVTSLFSFPRSSAALSPSSSTSSSISTPQAAAQWSPTACRETMQDRSGDLCSELLWVKGIMMQAEASESKSLLWEHALSTSQIHTKAGDY